jgi:hypothetical protein
MTSASKILTVSYGTFSCTLEGFDDPLTTMKIIAEYFRDLASDDRHFGALPSAPDTAMLHRIAERESRRQVEAKVQQDGGVHLRAGAPSEEPMEDTIAADAETPTEVPPIVKAPVRSAFAAPPSPSRIDDVAAKLMQIRASAKPETDPEDAAAFRIDPSDLEDDSGETVSGTSVDLDYYEQFGAHLDTPSSATMVADETIADWRLGENDGFMSDDPTYDLDEELARNEALFRGDEEPPAVVDQAEKLEKLVLSANDALHDDLPYGDEDSALAETIKSAISMQMVLDQSPPTPPEPLAAATPPEPAKPAEKVDLPVGKQLRADAQDTAAEPTTALGKLRQAKARLIKVSKLAMAPDAQSPDKVRSDPGQTGSPGDTLRELAAKSGDYSINRLIAQTNSEMDVPEQRARWSAIAHLKAAVATTVADRIARGGEDLPDDQTDAYKDELSRIVDPAGPAAATDRPTPLVLVSEQRIDRKVAEAEQPVAPVRPRRVSVSNLAVDKLPEVIDPLTDLSDEEDEDETDSGDVSVFFDPLDFAEFAQRLGADGISDMIQVAGVYAALIECRPYFSPMHLIRQITSAQDLGDFDPEEGLKSFGILLREGKIERVRRGQYVVTEESDFLIEARRILG